MSEIALQCHICGKLDIMVAVDLPIEECAKLYKAHIAEVHPRAKLHDMILEKYI